MHVSCNTALFCCRQGRSFQTDIALLSFEELLGEWTAPSAPMKRPELSNGWRTTFFIMQGSIMLLMLTVRYTLHIRLSVFTRLFGVCLSVCLFIYPPPNEKESPSCSNQNVRHGWEQPESRQRGDSACSDTRPPAGHEMRQSLQH